MSEGSGFRPSWSCPDCFARNAPSRTECRRCKIEIPEAWA